MATFYNRIAIRQIIVSVWLSMPVVQESPDSKPDWIHLRGLVDTGATVSGVSEPSTLRLLDSAKNRGTLPPITSRNVTTPSGVQSVLAYNVDVGLGIPSVTTYKQISRSQTNWIYHTLEVTVIHTEPNSTFDVLLGMDFLQYCHLSMYRDVFILSN